MKKSATKKKTIIIAGTDSQPVTNGGDHITYRSVFQLNKGTKATDFKQLARKLIKLAQNEVNTLSYNYFSNDAETVFTFIERYNSSKAAIAHGENNALIVKQMAAISKITLEVYGDASKTLKKSLPKTTTYFHHVGGIKVAVITC